METEQSDEMLMMIASKTGGIEPLLHTFFSFLHRKTDFYIQYPRTAAREPGFHAKMGFAEGADLTLRRYRRLHAPLRGRGPDLFSAMLTKSS